VLDPPRPESVASRSMPTIDANGLAIGYDVSGDGPPLVLLHGASSSAGRDFRGILPALRSMYRCFEPDARGHGRTRWDTNRLGFEAAWLVDDVLAFADAIGLETFDLLGFSMGGMTALGVAVRAPARLRTLVVVGITPEREPRASLARRLMDPERIDRSDPSWAADLVARHDRWQGDGAWRHLLPAIAQDVSSQPLLSPVELRSIDAPTLVGVGDRDPFTPVDHAWRLSRAVLDGRLLVVPGVGHECLAERPAVATEALTDFYRSTAAVAARRSQRSTIDSSTTEVSA
jgi:pimeloyl-ACP methyl ester carboxylesterase